MKGSNRRQGADEQCHSAHGNVGQSAGQNGEANDGRTHSGSARVVQHTPEPWSINELKPNGIDALYGDPTLAVSAWYQMIRCYSDRENPEIGDSIAAANAARIVACVNACEGINPAAVPEMVKALEILAMGRHTHLKWQGYSDACARCGLDLRNHIHFRVGESEQLDLEFARAALAKAKEA